MYISIVDFEKAESMAVTLLAFSICLVVRVARWYISTPKILVWVYFGKPWNRNFRYN
jgi:hypothetical protein